MTVAEQFGRSLKKLRLSRGMTQRDLAGELHVVPACISMWECGVHAPTLEGATEIAAYFSASLDAMCGYRDSTVLAVDPCAVFMAGVRNS